MQSPADRCKSGDTIENCLFFRDVSRLIDALEPVLDDPLKLQMLHCISRLLPPEAQLEFERLAVEMVARQMEST